MSLNRVVDVAERLVLGLGWLGFFIRFRAEMLIHPQYCLLVAEGLMIVAFVIFRPWTRIISTRPYPVILAFVATYLLLVVRPEGYLTETAGLGAVLMLAGFVTSVCATLTLNRRFGIVPANRGIQNKGPFAYVRHPIYAGYFVSYFGFLITNPTPWNISVYGLAFVLQNLRILEEEKVLTEDPAYREYRSRVRYRLLPGVY